MTAQAWIAGVGDPDRRTDLLATAASGIAATDPVDAVEWVLGGAVPDAERDHALNAVTAMWRGFAPDAAAQFTARAGLASE